MNIKDDGKVFRARCETGVEKAVMAAIASEREACAKIADEIAATYLDADVKQMAHFVLASVGTKIASLIRSRGETK